MHDNIFSLFFKDGCCYSGITNDRFLLRDTIDIDNFIILFYSTTEIYFVEKSLFFFNSNFLTVQLCYKYTQYFDSSSVILWGATKHFMNGSETEMIWINQMIKEKLRLLFTKK